MAPRNLWQVNRYPAPENKPDPLLSETTPMSGAKGTVERALNATTRTGDVVAGGGKVGGAPLDVGGFYDPRERTSGFQPFEPKPYMTDKMLSGAQAVTQDWLSGAAADPMREQMGEASARAIANMRAGAAQQAAAMGLSDQGAGYQASQATEQAALAQRSQDLLNAAITEQKMKEAGVTAATNLGNAGVQQQYADIATRKSNVDEMYTHANSLIEAGGAENIAEAGRVISEGTGINIDTSYIADDQAASRMFTRLADANRLAGQFGWDSSQVNFAIQDALEQGGQYTGMSDSQKQMLTRTTIESAAKRSNPYLYANALVGEAEMFGLNPEAASDLRTFNDFMNEGGAFGVKVVDGKVVVTDGTGNPIVTKTAEDLAYVQRNGGASVQEWDTVRMEEWQAANPGKDVRDTPAQELAKWDIENPSESKLASIVDNFAYGSADSISTATRRALADAAINSPEKLGDRIITDFSNVMTNEMPDKIAVINGRAVYITHDSVLPGNKKWKGWKVIDVMSGDVRWEKNLDKSEDAEGTTEQGSAKAQELAKVDEAEKSGL